MDKKIFRRALVFVLLILVIGVVNSQNAEKHYEFYLNYNNGNFSIINSSVVLLDREPKQIYGANEIKLFNSKGEAVMQYRFGFSNIGYVFGIDPISGESIEYTKELDDFNFVLYVPYKEDVARSELYGFDEESKGRVFSDSYVIKPKERDSFSLNYIPYAIFIIIIVLAFLVMYKYIKGKKSN